MTKWEYKIVHESKIPGVDGVDVTGDNWDRFLTKWLNGMGADGWELTGITEVVGIVLYFKRPCVIRRPCGCRATKHLLSKLELGDADKRRLMSGLSVEARDSCSLCGRQWMKEWRYGEDARGNRGFDSRIVEVES